MADSGTAQTAITDSNVLPGDYAAFSRQSPSRLVTGAMPCTNLWFPDNRKITRIAVRRALAYAYPYRAAWSASDLIEGATVFPATNVMPPGTPGRVRYNPVAGHQPAQTDPARAKAMLTKAHALGYVIRFPYRTDVPTDVTTKHLLVEALTRAGFDPRPVATTSIDYATDIQHNPAAPVNVRSVGWCSEWPSGAQWLPVLFQSTNLAKEGLGWNLAAFSNPDVDSRIEQVQSLPLSQQPAAWNDLETMIQTRFFPVIVRGYLGRALMRGSRVHGFFSDAILGEPTWKDIWLS